MSASANQPTSEKLISAAAMGAPTLEAFASASGDTNQIHLSEEVAKRSGLPGVIVHGMLSASLLSSFACEQVMDRFPGMRMSGLQIRFRAMVLRGESLVLRATVKDFSESSATIELSAKNAKGELVVSASATFST